MTAVDALAPIEDLLAEVQEKNHVRVQVFRARTTPFGVRRRRVVDELAERVVAQGPALWLADSARALRGLKPIYAAEALRRLGGYEFVGVAPNLRTTVGIDYTANALGSTSQPSQADYIGLSNNTATPAVGDSSSTAPWSTATATDPAPSGTSGEYTGLGLTRKQATYAHTGGVASYTMSATWTAAGAATSVRFAGLFGGAAKTAQGTGATNILFLENTFTATTLATNDQLSLTWTINV